MAFDFKKEYKEFYMPAARLSIVTVPPMNYIAVRGEGDPNAEDGAYKQAIGLLYGIAFTIKMSKKGDHRIEGFFDYVVPPLEGFWWQDGVKWIDYARKDRFQWISVIRLPDFVTKKDFDWAVAEATRKKKTDFSRAEFQTRKRVSNLAVFERVQSFLLNNYAAPFSITNLLNTLKKEGISTKPATVRSYIEYLKKAKVVYECSRFDLKSKKAVKREQKYYLADLAIYFSINTYNRLSYGPSLENIVYLYLASHNYQVSIGRIGNLECDFIVRDSRQQYAYIQVAYTLHGEDEQATEKIKEREYKPFRSIQDGYPRYIISLDRFRDQQEGVHHINAIDLFLGKVRI